MSHGSFRERIGYALADGSFYDTLSARFHVADAVPGDVEIRPLSHGYREAIPQLQLSLTYACNMHCGYCSFRSRMNEPGRPLNMEDELASRAIDLFLESCLAGGRYARIDFGLTGETFLRHKLHAPLRELISRKTASSGAVAIWTGPNTTNATLSRVVGIDASMGPPQDISCDGPKFVHDAQRPYVDGSGTYDDLLPIIKDVLSRHPDIGVTAVLTSRFTNFDEIFSHLYDVLGFRSIYMKPVNLPHDDPAGLNGATLDSFCRGYTRLVDHLMQQPTDSALLERLCALNREDYFMRFFYRVKNQVRNVYRCGAGKSGAYVDTDGTLYACAHFIGKTGHGIGDVTTGFDENEREKYRQLTVDSREPCRSCWAKYLCGGGCYYQATLTSGDISKPDLVKCELIRHLSAEALRLYQWLAHRKPDVLSAMPIDIHVSSSSLSAVSDTPYEPATRLIPSSSPSADPVATRELLTASHIDGSLAREGQSCGLNFFAADSCLMVEFNSFRDVTLERVDFWIMDLDQEKVRWGDLAAFNPSVFGEQIIWNGGTNVAVRIREERGPIRAIPYPTPKWRPLTLPEECNTFDGWKIGLNLQRICRSLPGARRFGINMTAYFRGGLQVRLVRHEPFALIQAPVSGLSPLILMIAEHRFFGGSVLNESQFPGMEPLSNWSAYQQNVC